MEITLNIPETKESITKWKIKDIYFSFASPAIKVTLVSNTGEDFVWRLIPNDIITANQILDELSLINEGKFDTLQKYLLDKITFDGTKIGTVSEVK